MEVVKVSAIDLAFGRPDLLPEMSKIPDEFKSSSGENKWVKLFNNMFFYGIKHDGLSLYLTPKEGVNVEDALCMVCSVMSSFAPKHEHKEAGCAYMLSCFFEDYGWYQDSV